MISVNSSYYQPKFIVNKKFIINIDFVLVYRINNSIKMINKSKILKAWTKNKVSIIKKIFIKALFDRKKNANNNPNNIIIILVDWVSKDIKMIVNGKIIKTPT